MQEFSDSGFCTPGDTLVAKAGTVTNNQKSGFTF